MQAAPGISNVQAIGVTQTGADITWNTTLPATSQVIITSGPGDDYTPARATVENSTLTLFHTVPLRQLNPGFTYWVYVVSRDAAGEAASTRPTNISFTTPEAPLTGAVDYTINTLGPKKVYTGSDLYFQMFSVRLNGPVEHLYMPLVTGLPPSIAAHLICRAYAPHDDGTENCFSDNGTPFSWGGNDAWKGEPVTVRLRTQADTPPGTYTVNIQTRSGTVQRTVPYTFTVEPLPTFTKTEVTTAPPIPGQALWEQTMLELGRKWCNPSQVFSFGSEAQVWYYDGARAYFQIADYTNDPSWLPCANNILTQYRANVISRGGALQGWRAFPHGLAMDYWRNAQPLSRTALELLQSGNVWVTWGGSPDPNLVRETVYALEVMVKYEQVTGKRDWHLTRTADYLLGDIDMLSESDTHGMQQAFYNGLLMEGLIQYYELTHDVRVPLRIKKLLDWIWDTEWHKQQHKLQYNPLDVPSDYSTISNHLLAPGFAWYWSVSGDNTYLERGDEIFQHGLDEDITYSGKIFVQNYRWSFDYVRWRRGAVYSTTAPPSNDPARALPRISNLQAGASSSTVNLQWSPAANSSQVFLQRAGGGLLESNIFLFPSVDSPSITLDGLQSDTVYTFKLEVMGATGDRATTTGAFHTLARPASLLPWAHRDWSHRIPLTVDRTRLVNGMPVLLDITLSALLLEAAQGHVAQPDGSDIAFFDTTGQPVPEERRLYDPATGHLVSWIRLPEDGAGVYLYLGNPAPPAATGAVWDSGFAAVWHLDTSASTVISTDSSPQQRHGDVRGGLPPSTGVSGGGVRFDFDRTQFVDIPASALPLSGTAFTLETWIRPASTNEEQPVLGNYAGDTNAGFLIKVGNGLAPVIRAEFGTGAGAVVAGTVSPLPLNVWSYLAVTYDGTSARIFVNGKPVAVQPTGFKTGPVLTSAVPMRIGPAAFWPSYSGAMDLDEVRISTVVRSDAWIDANYLSLTVPGLLQTGETEERPALTLPRRR